MRTWHTSPGGWLNSGAGEHLILVGLPGSGKSTVGRAVAAALGWPFVDLDAEIVAREGRPISAIFASDGEPRFRELEQDATRRLRGVPPSVVAPGGGWVTVPATVALVCPPARMTYLKVSPETAARRLRRTVRLRPLLRGDPLRALRRLLEARLVAYESADLVVDTELLTPQDVTRCIVALAKGPLP
jgi:shikimate kinase